VQDGQYLEIVTTEVAAADQVAVTGVSRLSDGVAVDVKSAESLTARVIDPDKKVPASKSEAKPDSPGAQGGDK
jgi:hypothetical protein